MVGAHTVLEVRPSSLVRSAHLGSRDTFLVMGYPVQIALRYLGSKKRAFVSVGTAFAMLGVALGVAALAIVMSVTGGFQEQFREKVLGVNAHVIVLKYAVHFRDYRDVMKKVEGVPGVVAVAPFVINPMMVTHGERTATGVLLKGVDPELMPKVLDLPRHIVEGSLDGMRKPGAKPPEAPRDSFSPGNSGGWDPGKTGSSGDSGAGTGKLSLLEAIERQIAEDKAQDTAADAGTSDLATLIATGAAGAIATNENEKEKQKPPPSADPLDAILAAPAAPAAAKEEPPPPLHPAGDVTPTGGYTSTLPEDDFLPEAIDPDPVPQPRASEGAARRRHRQVALETTRRRAR